MLLRDLTADYCSVRSPKTSNIRDTRGSLNIKNNLFSSQP